MPEVTILIESLVDKPIHATPHNTCYTNTSTNNMYPPVIYHSSLLRLRIVKWVHFFK